MESLLTTVCKVAGGVALGLLGYDFFLVKQIRRKLEEEFDRQRRRLPGMALTPVISSLPAQPEAPALAGQSNVAAGGPPVPVPAEKSGQLADLASDGDGLTSTKRREVLFLEMQRRELEKYSKSLVDQQAKLDEERIRLQEDRKALDLERTNLEQERRRWAGAGPVSSSPAASPERRPPARPPGPAEEVFTIP